MRMYNSMNVTIYVREPTDMTLTAFDKGTKHEFVNMYIKDGNDHTIATLSFSNLIELNKFVNELKRILDEEDYEKC